MDNKVSPLDLRAVEAQLIRQVTHSARCFEEGNGCLCGSERAVVETFAHCRALRAALEKARVWLPHEDGRPYDGDIREAEGTLEEIAAVLAQATDQEGT